MQNRTVPCAILASVFVGTVLTAAPTHARVKKGHAASQHAHPVFRQADTQETSTWQQNPSLLKQLDPAVPVTRFSMRPPQGYLFHRIDRDKDAETVHTFAWDAPTQPDQSVAKLRITITALKPHSVAVQTLDGRMDELIGSMEQASPGKVHSPYQHGMINGISFVRTYFKDGPDAPAEQPKTHGFIYKATSNDGKAMITIIGGDVEPFNETTLPLLEASVLTFRKP